MRQINKIIIHCTATPAGRHVTVADVDRWHRAQGFNSIGYHYLILLDGTVQPGRPLHLPGAHTRGHNATSIGIAYVGGLDPATNTPADTRTPAQRNALKKLINRLINRFPGVTVHGHNQFAPKACPCFSVPHQL